MRTRAEAVRGVSQPIQMYPIFENAIRHARGETLDGHIRRVSEMWAGFSRVAAGNPHAWIRQPATAEEIRTPSETNRPVSFPYPKLMNSNSNVDQAAALILCSTLVARRLGIPEGKWVYPWAATAAHDTYAVSNRDNLHSSPGIRIAGGPCAGTGGRRCRRHCPRGSLQLFPVGGAGGCGGTGSRRRTTLDRDRRASRSAVDRSTTTSCTPSRAWWRCSARAPAMSGW